MTNTHIAKSWLDIPFFYTRYTRLHNIHLNRVIIINTTITCKITVSSKIFGWKRHLTVSMNYLLLYHTVFEYKDHLNPFVFLQGTILPQ